MYGVQFNAGQSRKALREAMHSLDDMVPVYEDIAEYLVEVHRKRFIEGKGPDGKPWAKKSQATLDRYKRLGYGSLSRPLIGPGKALSRQIQRFVSKGGVIIGSSLIYSGVMQDGAQKGAFGTNARGNPIPWGRIPARPWLGLSVENGTAIVEIVEEWLEPKLNASN